jgi:hypothetical protein
MALNVEQPLSLFNRWKSGDAEAGQEMAQRFSDWYFAVATTRHGEQKSRQGLERACQLFAQGIGAIDDGQDLETWAHGLLDDELQGLDNNERGSDEASRLTGNRLPSRLLRRCVAEAECPGLPLLAMAWNPEIPLSQLIAHAEEAGGYPLSILKARYELKAWLGAQESVPFSEVPAESNLDYLPLPLYEADRLPPDEARQFERWLLQDASLRQDAMEFSNFSMALHTGVFNSLCAKADAVSKRNIKETDTPMPRFSYQVPDAGWSPEPWVIAIGACVLGILAALLTLS